MKNGDWEEIGIWRQVRPKERDTCWERLRFLLESRSYFEARLGHGSAQLDETYVSLLNRINQEIVQLGRQLRETYQT